MIYVVRAISATATVQAPTIIDGADAQLSPVGPAIGLSVSNPLTRVLCDFPPALEVSN